MNWYHVDILLTALDDIREIQKNIIDFSGDIEFAQKQKERIFAAIDKLSVSPKIYRIRRKDAFNRELRYLPVGKYFVVYVLYDDEKIVNVINVIHEKRDIDSLI